MSQSLNLSAPADDSAPGDDAAASLSAMSIRELIGALTAIEDRLRHLPTFVPLSGRLVTNPERRLLLRRQRLVIATLRRRRATLRLPATSS